MQQGPPIAPVIILVEPQMPQNIGMTARAMANFGLSALRLVAPREGWPHPDAVAPAVAATAILEQARAFDSTADAIGDLSYVLATTARARGQMKRAVPAEAAFNEIAERERSGQRTGILFGRERTGLQNDDISLADAILTFPVEPAFASLNLAQAVLLAGYEWRRAAGSSARTADAASPPGEGSGDPMPARREAIVSLFDAMEHELEEAGFYPPNKKPIMSRNMRDMFHRMKLTEQDVSTWHGAIRALSRGRERRKAYGHTSSKAAIQSDES